MRWTIRDICIHINSVFPKIQQNSEFFTQSDRKLCVIPTADRNNLCVRKCLVWSIAESQIMEVIQVEVTVTFVTSVIYTCPFLFQVYNNPGVQTVCPQGGDLSFIIIIYSQPHHLSSKCFVMVIWSNDGYDKDNSTLLFKCVGIGCQFPSCSQFGNQGRQQRVLR